MTSKEVAFELGVSDATVRVLISRALRKLGRPRRRRR
jgi:DNA-binding NarL/FixJ family response regulator